MEVSGLTWALTLGFVAALVICDVLIHRKPHAISLRHAAISTGIWTAIGLAFTLVVLTIFGKTAAGEYFTGYLLERTLSIDNVFVFVVILSYFSVPEKLQHRALLFGVLAALILRAIFIFGGLAILDKFEWTIYLFGALLIFTAYKLATSDEQDVDPEHNLALKALRKVMPVSNNYDGHKLITRTAETAKKSATPLLAVLLVIGSTDLVFAVDSIPAIFAITQHSYLVFTSNAFAVLGLYAMTFLLARVMDRFAYLKHALAIVLALVGMKMLGSHFYHINTWLSLAVIAAILGGGVIYSVIKTKEVAPS